MIEDFIRSLWQGEMKDFCDGKELKIFLRMIIGLEVYFLNLVDGKSLLARKQTIKLLIMAMELFTQELNLREQ
jgi:hypothetical protein